MHAAPQKLQYIHIKQPTSFIDILFFFFLYFQQLDNDTQKYVWHLSKLHSELLKHQPARHVSASS